MCTCAQIAKELTIAGSPNGQSTNQFVAQRFGLCNGTQSSNSDLLRVELNGTRLEPKPLRDDCRQFPNPTALVPKNILSPSGHDDDFCTVRSHTNLQSGIAIFCQLPHEKLVQLRPKEPFTDKLLEERQRLGSINGAGI